ncbi:30160_t:CDS:2 [Gigaspora margarita]|uniref:30160_t:CDS:1 n=1 Tax=Gigaspora margarita TaxID=4874 RepID=A0ABM8W3G1_GIGMA|nr:30160_t:CDS:2 [Gigaspora margarita]
MFIADHNFDTEEKILQALFINKPLLRTEIEKVIPTYNNDKEVLDYLKEFSKSAHS